MQHREDGCCTEKIGAAQGGRVLHSSWSREAAPQRDTRWTKKVQRTAMPGHEQTDLKLNETVCIGGGCSSSATDTRAEVGGYSRPGAQSEPH